MKKIKLTSLLIPFLLYPQINNLNQEKILSKIKNTINTISPVEMKNYNLYKDTIMIDNKEYKIEIKDKNKDSKFNNQDETDFYSLNKDSLDNLEKVDKDCSDEIKKFVSFLRNDKNSYGKLTIQKEDKKKITRDIYGYYYQPENNSFYINTESRTYPGAYLHAQKTGKQFKIINDEIYLENNLNNIIISKKTFNILRNSNKIKIYNEE